METGDQNENKTGYDFSDFLEDEIKDASFKVSIYPHRVLPHLFMIAFPIIFYVMFISFFRVLDATGLESYTTMFQGVLVLVFLMGLYFFMLNCGKEVVVSGHGIVLRRFFIMYESLNVSEVERCEVITGLVTGGKIHEHYSKLVICYGDGRKFYMEDNLFKGWQRLVRYMEMNGKVVRIDGRKPFWKSMD